MRTQKKINASTIVWSALVACLVVVLSAQCMAYLIQTDFGRVRVQNVSFTNQSGILVRAKLLHPSDAGPTNSLPGIVYIHGYQNNRETSDPYTIELARRGFAVLAIDAIGRGNSGNPGDEEDPGFDQTYGGSAALAYLKALPIVNPQQVGMMGHSLGAEMAYTVALNDDSVRALAFSGFAYTSQADFQHPRNMLMIFGKYDEYRQRMTGTRDFEREWLASAQTHQVVGSGPLQFGQTYGEFSTGTARRVVMPAVTHVLESHSEAAVAEALLWMRQALAPDARYWIDPADQTWPIKETATLVAMLAGIGSLVPLGWLLMRTRLFAPLRGAPRGMYHVQGGDFGRYALINGLLAWLYLPLVLVLFAVHLYVVRIDKAFPLMMANGIIFWFVVTNLAGFLLFRGWYRKQARLRGLSLWELGISHEPGRFALNTRKLLLTLLLAAILFGFVYLLEAGLEQLLIVDYRFVFPFASDLTPYRFLMWLLYFPFLLAGFVFNGIFLHGQLRLPERGSQAGTFFAWWGANAAVVILPLVSILLVQYVPLFTAGIVPFTGPGAALVGFVINLVPILLKLVIATGLSTWYYRQTGEIYLGALLNAALVSWMFASSQVIAPVPV